MEVFVFDDVHPEDNAMLQALYSRSPCSVLDHVEKIKEVGSGKFMESYYIGYGHSSIGDCGSTTVYMENVSMVVAKALQDNPLYSGQEASTRYLDYSTQEIIDPYNNADSRKILDRWMEIYNGLLPKLQAGLKSQHPYDASEYKTEAVWEKTIAARSFDIARSLLPLGTTTYVSWHTNLRQARDHLRKLFSHPLQEVRDVAGNVYENLKAKYPNSFTGEENNADSERYKDRNAYDQKYAVENNFLDPNTAFAELSKEDQDIVLKGGVALDSSLMDVDGLNANEADIIADRPKGSLLPRQVGRYGHYTYTYLLDFGSYRDIQRHRNAYCRNPIVTDKFGFGSWYKNEMQTLLSEADFTELWGSIDEQLAAVKDIASKVSEANEMDTQYLYPMGMECLVQASYSLPQTVYVVDLRTSKYVHPSLRSVIQDLAQQVQAKHPKLKLYADYDLDSWTAKRGEQDITMAKKAS